MGGRKKQTIGYRYCLGLHAIFTHGPVDKFTRLEFDKRIAWQGDVSSGSIQVSKPDLFGGDEREGGVVGVVDVMLGEPTQTVNTYLASQLGDHVPAFRGASGLVFKGGVPLISNAFIQGLQINTAIQQFYFGMSPYLKHIAARMQRIHKTTDGAVQWYDAKAAIGIPNEALITFQETFSNGFTPYYVVNGSMSAFSLSGSQVNMLPSAPGGTNRIARSLPVPEGAHFRKLRFKLRVNALGGGDTGILQIFDKNGVYIHGFNAGWPGAAYKPIVGYNSAEGFTATVGNTTLAEGRWYQYEASYDIVLQRLTCKLTDLTDNSVFGEATINGPSAPAAELRIWTEGAGRDVNVYDIFVDYVIFNEGDMNPAHIIRECLTDPDWGMGYSASDVDDVSFTAAADALFSEQMGISLLWDRQIPIEEFVKEVIKHIDAALYVDRKTGKFTLKLIRNDYNAASLLVLDESNIDRIDNFSRSAFGELTNSVTVNYWDAATGNDASLTVQDIALSQMQGATINTTLQYHGFTNAYIATRVAQRDLTTLSTPLISCTIYTNRIAEDLTVGSVFKLSWSDYEISNLVMRVTGIAYGDGRNNRIRITCTQDIFSLPSEAFIPYVPPVISPGTDVAPSPNRLAIELPYLELTQRQGQAAVDSALAQNANLAYVGISATRPNASALNAKVYTDSGAGYSQAAELDFVPNCILRDAIDLMAVNIPIQFLKESDILELNSLVQFGSELMSVVSINADFLQVKRGVLDTLPVAHNSGEVGLFWDAFLAADSEEYASGETVNFKVLTDNGTATLDPNAAPVDAVTAVGRAIKPYPPAKLTINGSYFPETVNSNPLALTWVHRDRTQQTSGTVYGFTDGNIGPETGVTYTLRIYSQENTLLRTVGGSSATSYTYATDDEILDSGGVGGDPNYNNVASLLHFEGTDGATAIVDEKGKTWTAVNQAQLDTAQFKFGGASALFDGASDRFTSQSSADFTMGTGDFTIEFWVRPVSIGGYQAILADNTYPSAGGFSIYMNGSSLEIWLQNSIKLHDVASAFANNTWTHIAWTRSGTNSYAFVNGVATAAVTNNTNLVGAVIHIGGRDVYYLNGHVDEVRITKGIARYTATFTPQTGPFPGGSIGGLNGKLRIELESVKNGKTSFTKYNHTVYRAGYGWNYGLYYGGLDAAGYGYGNNYGNYYGSV